MLTYPKIESLYNRDETTHKFKAGEFRLPVFEYLYPLQWQATEKVDGTNIRVGWDGESVTFGGRTDRAQIPTFLLARLQDLFSPEKFADKPPMVLFGEGYGAKIQKGGGNYKADGVDFVLFDANVDGWWLQFGDIDDVANSLGISTVPVMAFAGMDTIERMVARGFESAWGRFPAEGVVAKPAVDMLQRNGERIIVKLKTKDFGDAGR